MVDATTASSGEMKHLALRGVHIIVVDDDSSVRALYAIVLREAGATVVASGTASEAIQLAELLQPGDVVVTDVCMPERDGVWLLQELITRMPAVSVIAITGDANAPEDDHLLDLGFAEVLRKPIILSRLTSTVAHVVKLHRCSNLTREERRSCDLWTCTGAVISRHPTL